jgi:hypothetical protein
MHCIGIIGIIEITEVSQSDRQKLTVRQSMYKYVQETLDTNILSHNANVRNNDADVDAPCFGYMKIVLEGATFRRLGEGS